MAHEIDIYKATRARSSVAAASLLTKQADAARTGRPGTCCRRAPPAHDQVVVSAVQSDNGVQTINVKPTDLQPAITYQVQSVDTGILGTATGAALMTGGIDIIQSPNSAAHILIITARQQ